jgi:S1-C subfamily serine protease
MSSDPRPFLRAIVTALVFLGPSAPLVRAGAAPEAAQAVQQIDDHTYRVDGAALAAALRAECEPCEKRGKPGTSPLRAFSRSARFVPEGQEGAWSGLRLLSVRPEGAVARLGFRDGDVVRSVNGMPVGGPAQTLRVYALLKEAARATVALEREGRKLELVYHLR